MSKALRKLLGVSGIGLAWGTAWGAFFVTLVLIIGIVRPQDIDTGEGPLVALAIGCAVGFVSGVVFGVILSVAERRTPVLDLAPLRVTIWGTIAAATWPLLTHVDDRMVFILCPLGAACALVSVAVAREAELQPNRPRLLKWIGKLLAKPLQAACA